MAREKRIHKTPNGGDYSELVYMNSAFEEVDKEQATNGVIYEWKNNGELVGTTYCVLNGKELINRS